MKRFISFILVLMLLVNTFAVISFASDKRDLSENEERAKILKELNLFRGVSETDFALGRAPSRTEALVILVRLLGKEAEAMAKDYEHPFTDVDPWADPYIGYGYSTGLTNGISATLFGKSDANAATFLTFVLRALGYSDKGGADFTWDNPFPLAKKTGILTDDVNTSDFLRADVVTVAYNALCVNLKDSKTTLAEKLIGDGVFTESDYKQYYKNANAKENEPITGKEEGISIRAWKRGDDTGLYKDYNNTRNDEFSYCLTDTSANDLRIMKSYKVKPNTLYVVSVDVKTENVVNHENEDSPLGASISLESYNNSKGILGTSDWQTLRVIGRSDADGNLQVSMNLGYFSNTCTGTAWFENIEVVEAENFAEEDNTWRFLAVILVNNGIDDRYPDTNKRVKISHTMPKAQINAIRNSLDMFEDDLTTLANGNFRADVDVIEMTALCDDYSMGDTGFRVSSNSARQYLIENGVDYDDYDHVTFIACLPGIVTQYYGLGGMTLDGFTGYSFVIHSDVDHCIKYLNGQYKDRWPAAVYVHEFLHFIETYSKRMKFDIPVLHDAEEHGYENVYEWYDWYYDFINKKIRSNGKYIGVDPLLWKIRPGRF